MRCLLIGIVTALSLWTSAAAHDASSHTQARKYAVFQHNYHRRRPNDIAFFPRDDLPIKNEPHAPLPPLQGGATATALSPSFLQNLLFERHTLSALFALSLFCTGVYAMWIIVEEFWELIGIRLGCQKQLPLIQMTTSALLARVNGWMWWSFLNEQQYSSLEQELSRRKTSQRLCDFMYGTTVGNLLSVFSYISCFLACASLFYSVVEWTITTVLGRNSFGTNESIQYMIVSMGVLAVSGVGLYRLLNYDMLLAMWDVGEDEE